MKQSIGVLFKGMCMGAADAVPGVSGGTIALIVGIYQELIETIKRFGPNAIVVWRKNGVQALAGYLNLRFVLPLIAGIAISLFSVAHLVTWLMQTQPLLLNAFFFGLVFASAWVVYRQIKSWSWRYVLPAFLAAVFALYLPSLMPAVTNVSYLGLFIAGAVAICAMLLPGVSGSFLLLMMGLYGTVMSGIKNFDLGLIAVFGAGCVLGLLTFSRLLSWLLRYFHDATMAVIIGFIVGSLPTLWPWRQMTQYFISDSGESIGLSYRYFLPADFSAITGIPAQPVSALLLILAGIVVVLLLGERKPSVS